MPLEQTFHRPGPLKQTNKAHKTGRHRSKGEIYNANKGRVTKNSNLHRRHRELVRKDLRRKYAKETRKNKRQDVLDKKRQIGGSNTAPFLVCLLPMHMEIDPESALTILRNCDDEAVVDKSQSGITYITIPRFKQRFSFVIPQIGLGYELDVLDYLKVCDTTILLTSAFTGDDEVFDKWGHSIYNMMAAQGIPSPIVALMDLESINPKKRIQTKASIQKFISNLLPVEKLVQLDTTAEGMNMFRRIGTQKRNVLLNKDNRAHLFAENVEFIANNNDENGLLKVTGYLRGIPLNVNGLVYIPGLGDFQMSQIESFVDPYKIEKNIESPPAVLIREQNLVANKIQQTPLKRENIPDDMDDEQTWPTEDEIAASNEETRKSRLIKRIPKGMSDYQACWIPDVEEVDDEDDDDDQSGTDSDDDFMSCESDLESNMEMEDTSTVAPEEYDVVSVSDAPIEDEKYDLAMDLQEERDTLQKIKQARVDQLWPDEIDTPNDMPARQRFEKYRGLESFRASQWDMKENLPSDYARIFRFKDFNRVKRRIIKEAAEADGAMPGWYITIHIIDVPVSKWNLYRSAQKSENLVVYGVLPHEHKMTVVHVVLKRIPDSEVPLKSKEAMVIQCGYRRFTVNPIFSQHTNGDKHKFERYFRPHSTVVATFYAPIQFPPAPVLCFKENPNTTLRLVARGSLLSCNPDRVIVKRVVLSGHPMRIHRKSATVRYMFFNKEDVEYFKPIQLRTKCGRHGHIKESLGTHGHMKCIFDGQLKSFDTVFLYLYKRVFPKWNYEECVVGCADDSNNQKMQE